MVERTYSRIEQPAANTVEDPGVDQQREAIAQGDIDDCLEGEAVVCRAGRGLRDGGDLCAEGVEEEERRAEEFAGEGNDMAADGGPHAGFIFVVALDGRRGLVIVEDWELQWRRLVQKGSTMRSWMRVGNRAQKG